MSNVFVVKLFNNDNEVDVMGCFSSEKLAVEYCERLIIEGFEEELSSFKKYEKMDVHVYEWQKDVDDVITIGIEMHKSTVLNEVKRRLCLM